MATPAPNLPPKVGSPPRTAASPQTHAPHPFPVTSGRIDAPQRIVLYGTGGIGKSTLAALAPCAVMLDLESGTRDLDVERIESIESFAGLRACLQGETLDGYTTVVIDSGTKAEELAVAHTLETVKHDKGHHVTSIEGYGFGKGYQHVYDTFLLLLADLDQQIRAGRHVIVIAHDCIESVPNPVGTTGSATSHTSSGPGRARRRSGTGSFSGRTTCCSSAMTWWPKTARAAARARGPSGRASNQVIWRSRGASPNRSPCVTPPTRRSGGRSSEASHEGPRP